MCTSQQKSKEAKEQRDRGNKRLQQRAEQWLTEEDFI